LKLQCVELLSSFASNFNLRRYNVLREASKVRQSTRLSNDVLLGSSQLRGRALRVVPIKPTLTLPGTQRLKL